MTNTMQTMMRAIVCDGAGEAAVMRMAEVARPEPSVGQVLIKVQASGVNRPDVLQRSGKYTPPADASPLLGLEVAGTIVAGDLNDMGEFKIGDAVCALVHGGGYAEYVVAERAQCLPIPHGWSIEEAASLPETFFTVWFNVFDRAHLGRDNTETLLVHAGASGIGVAAIQMAHAMGQTIWASAGTAEKRKMCLQLGADGVFDYHDSEWSSHFLAATQQHGADVVLDMIGGDSLANNIKVMAQGGRLAWIAFLAGARVELKIQDIMAREISLTGSYLRRQSNAVKARIAEELRKNIWPKIGNREISPVIDRYYDAKDVVLAHRHMESNTHIGKIVLQWS